MRDFDAQSYCYSLWFMLSTHMTTYCNHTGGVKIVWLEPYVNTWSHGSLVKMALSCAYCIKVCHMLDKEISSLTWLTGYIKRPIMNTAMWVHFVRFALLWIWFCGWNVYSDAAYIFAHNILWRHKCYYLLACWKEVYRWPFLHRISVLLSVEVILYN